MESQEAFRRAINSSTVAEITDAQGNVVERLTPGQAKATGLEGQIPAFGPKPVYKVGDNWSMDVTSAPNPTVTLNETTGKITVDAPSEAYGNKAFTDSIKETLGTLSANYKLNPNYKYSVVNEAGENEAKSVQDIIADLNKPAQNEDGSYNGNSLQYMVQAAIGMERAKTAHKKNNNVDLTDDDIIRMSTVAVGPDVKANTLQLISDLPQAAWLRNVSSYNAETGMAQYGDIMENAYNKERTSSEDMIKLWAALENYFAKGDFSDKEQYIKNVATARFLQATQPNMAWIRDVTENVTALLDGIGGFATNLGTAGWVAVERIGDFFGFEGDWEARDEYYETYPSIDSSEFQAGIARGGNPFSNDPLLSAGPYWNKIGRISFDENGVPTYGYEPIAGTFETPRTTGELLRAEFKKNQAIIQKDRAYLHASQNGWDAVGYTIANLATLISAGNVLSDAFAVGAGRLATLATAGSADTAVALADTASALYASGSALGWGSTAAEAAQIVSGIKTIYDIAAVTGKAGTFLNFIGQAVASAKTTEFIIGIVGESLAEAVVGDPDRLTEVLANNDVNADTKMYLIDTYLSNAMGWGIGLSVGKFLMKAGDTARGRAISANLSRRIFKIQNSVGEAFDQALLTIRRVKGDDLASKIKTLYESGGKYAQKQANSLAANALLRDMRRVIADSDAVQISGKTTAEIEEALADLEMKINTLQGAENALTSMQRQGMDIVHGWLTDKGTGLLETTENFYTKAAKIVDLEKTAGDIFTSEKGAATNLATGKVLKLFSQTTTNYIKATEKIDFINAYIRKYEHAADITEDILRKIEGYKKELPELQEMVNKFVNNASEELKLAADNFIDADRKWWARFEDLRSRLGLTSADELAGMRGSGLWGTNGELYARTSRKADLSEYVVRHRDGASNVKTFDNYEQYMAGATGDFSDPLAEMQLALYDAGSKQAYRSFTRSYNALTGALVTKVSGEETALFDKMKKGLESAYFKSSENFLKGMVEEAQTGTIVEDVVKNLKLKNEATATTAKAKAAMKTSAEKFMEKQKEVTSENAAMFIQRLGVEDTNDLWDEFYDVSVRELLADGKQFVPNQTKSFITRQATNLGINLPENASTVETFDAVNKALAGTADSPDLTFEQKVKRSIMKRNENILNDTRVQRYLTELNQQRYERKMDVFMKELQDTLRQAATDYDVSTEALNAAGWELVDGYLESMTRKGTGQRAAIDELCRYYGLEGDENAVQYFALSAFMNNKDKYKKELYEQLRDAIAKEHKNFTNKDTDKIAKVITNGTSDYLESEWQDAYLTVKEMNPAAVIKDDEKVMREVDDIAKKIEDAKSNQYAGDKNIIAMRNAQGQVEYYQADPLLARLVNFEYKPQHMNGLTQAIYNTNYLWAKLFRLGTTAINLKSMISQSFRDPINMFIGGGAYRTTQQVMDDIVDVAGDDVVAWLKTYEPEALGRLQKTASETGESVQELAVKREFELGRSIAPGATETSMYKSLATAKRARFNGALDVYDDTAGDKFVRGLDKVGNVLGKGNEWRETTLRNLSYQNGLAKALKRGYSLDQARTYATFVMNEATTNFTRMTGHLVSLKDTVPYFGSAINGTKSFYRLLSMDPVGVVGRLTGGIIIPAMALTAHSLMTEENREVYKNIPEYQKEDALVFVANGQVFSIPIPQELGAFIAPFRQAVEGMNGVTTNTFAQFAWNDILGFSPIDLAGFAELDFAKLEQSSPGFLDRINRGITRLWSQLAPAPLKSGLEIITGVDPYTGKPIDKSYLDYDEDGNPIVKDYQSGELAKLLNNMFRAWGLTSSAPVVQNILSNIIGQGSVDIADFLISLGTQVPNGGWAFTATEQQLSRGEGYNPLYVLGERLTGPVVIEAYDEAQSAWKTEVAKLYNMKSEILRSDAWSEYLEAKRNTDDPEKLKNIDASKKNIVEDYFNTVKTTVENLQKNYGEQFTAAKYATVLSLMTMNENTLDAGSYGEYLNKEEYKTARAQAIQTMISLGFPSSSSTDILGQFTTSQSGDIYVRTNSPLAILQLDDMSASLSSQSNRQHEAVVRGLVQDAGLFDHRSNYQKKISAAMSQKNYTEAEKLTNEYNEKLIRAVGSYIQQYSPESVLRGDALTYLSEFVIVPSSFRINKYGKYATGLGNGAYITDAFKEPYLKYIFNYGDNKL